MQKYKQLLLNYSKEYMEVGVLCGPACMYENVCKWKDLSLIWPAARPQKVFFSYFWNATANRF